MLRAKNENRQKFRHPYSIRGSSRPLQTEAYPARISMPYWKACLKKWRKAAWKDGQCRANDTGPLPLRLKIILQAYFIDQTELFFQPVGMVFFAIL